MSKKSSKDDILFIESHQIFRVSIYSEGITAAYFDHNNECWLEIIGRISSSGLVIYVFVGPTKENIPVLYHYSEYNRLFSHFRHHIEIRLLDPFSSKIISLNDFFLAISKIKHNVRNYHDRWF